MGFMEPSGSFAGHSLLGTVTVIAEVIPASTGRTIPVIQLFSPTSANVSSFRMANILTELHRQLGT